MALGASWVDSQTTQERGWQHQLSGQSFTVSIAIRGQGMMGREPWLPMWRQPEWQLLASVGGTCPAECNRSL